MDSMRAFLLPEPWRFTFCLLTLSLSSLRSLPLPTLSLSVPSIPFALLPGVVAAFIPAADPRLDIARAREYRYCRARNIPATLEFELALIAPCPSLLGKCAASHPIASAHRQTRPIIKPTTLRAAAAVAAAAARPVAKASKGADRRSTLITATE
ncbi:hypothetical protein CALCODRAFT_71552 [Calocera cornea HHB12733]|uniref:Uncharacterized protein n=1 Tax=Calocera cornea HHB12733 TaxID=1353952 RepID=A0A165IS58_9BASI|nr:hypothetical protein CALCODRAFT_71552 [Calocera cornea HHB12733]